MWTLKKDIDMPAIADLRPVLLSAPYADPETNLEVKHHLKSGYRTCGMVEMTLEDGTTGLGEGYVAVFAPRVFEAMVKLLRPYLIGREVMGFNSLYADLQKITGYWSMQGAAQHAISAVEIALQDCRAKVLDMPVYAMLGGKINSPIRVYGSGGDSTTPKAMEKELDYLQERGIEIFKIRARNHQANKVIWCQREGAKRGIEIAVDMAQNLEIPGQSVSDVISFYRKVSETSGMDIYFLEEALGPKNTGDYPLLRNKINTRIAGGEIVTTATELCNRIGNSVYDIAQPDATVIGGITAVMEVFSTGRRHGVEVVVHCWGGPVGMMANFHAALACGGQLVEWPMPSFPLRKELIEGNWGIKDGMLELTETPGLGVKLTNSVEENYEFREDAVYTCLVKDKSAIEERWL